MNQRENPIVDVIEQLWKSRNLIAEAYHQRSIIPDESDLTKIKDLRKSRLLIQESGKHSVRLSQKLSRFLDFAIRKDRMVEINANLGEKIGILRQILIALEDANTSSNIEEWQQNRDEFEDELFDITESLDVITLDVQSRVEKNFGVATSLEVRKQENLYYLRELSRLIETLQTLRLELSEEPFVNNSAIESMLHGFPAELIPFHDRIKETQRIITEYLFQQRQLEERTQKIRALSYYLRKHPAFYPDQSVEVAEDSPYFRKVSPINILAYPNVSEPLISQEFAELVQDIQSRLSTPTRKVDRKTTTLDSVGNVEETETVSLQEEAILYFLEKAVDSDKALSALDFYDEHSKNLIFVDAALSQGDWLWLLTSYFDNDPEQDDGSTLDNYLKLQMQLEQNQFFAGNAILKDVYVYPSILPEDKALNSMRSNDKGNHEKAF